MNIVRNEKGQAVAPAAIHMDEACFADDEKTKIY